MKVKHKLLCDYQYTTPDKKIFVLKTGTILQNYMHSIKDEKILIDKDIVDNNTLFFSVIDWKNELHRYLKSQKLPTPSILAKTLIPLIEDMILSSMQQSVN